MPSDPHIVVAAATNFAARAAREISERLREAVATQERATLALAGGETPRSVYRRLAEGSDGAASVDWGRVDFFWSDERLVPADHSRSNVGMARRELLEPLGVDSTAVHAPSVEGSAAQAAGAYEEEVLRVVGSGAGEAPVFDMILLGLGTDGHTASLFPGAAGSAGRWVIPAVAPQAPHERISFSLGLLRAARALVVLAAGAGKAEIVRRVLVDRDPDLPATRLPLESTQWILDADAAGRL